MLEFDAGRINFAQWYGLHFLFWSYAEAEKPTVDEQRIQLPKPIGDLFTPSQTRRDYDEASSNVQGYDGYARQHKSLATDGTILNPVLTPRYGNTFLFTVINCYPLLNLVQLRYSLCITLLFCLRAAVSTTLIDNNTSIRYRESTKQSKSIA